MITGLCDEFPKTLGKHREMFVLALLGGIYLCALPTCTYVKYYSTEPSGPSQLSSIPGRKGSGGDAERVRLRQPDPLRGLHRDHRSLLVLRGLQVLRRCGNDDRKPTFHILESDLEIHQSGISSG